MRELAGVTGNRGAKRRSGGESALTRVAVQAGAAVAEGEGQKEKGEESWKSFVDGGKWREFLQ